MNYCILILLLITFVIIAFIISWCVITPTIFYVIDRFMTYITVILMKKVIVYIVEKRIDISLPNPNHQTNYSKTTINPPNPVQDFRNLIIKGNHLIKRISSKFPIAKV